MNDSPKARLSEQAINDALDSLDWNAFERHLQEVDLADDVVDALLDHVRRSGAFLLTRPAAKKQLARTAFVANLSRHLDERCGPEASGRLQATIEQIETIEDGYRSIMATLAKTNAAKLPEATQLWAALDRSAFSYHDLKRLERETLEGKKELSPQSFTVTLEDGTAWAPDALLTSIVEIATSTLLMMGHVNRWFEGDFLTLPARVETTEGERFKAGATEALASWWGQWKDLEQRSRHLGGDIVVHKGDELPDWSPPNAGRVIVHDSFGGVELFDMMANQRHSERMIQTYHEMTVGTDIEAQAQGIERQVALPPQAFVTEVEAHACVSMSETLGYSIVDDTARPGGLRLVEWVRGYATLRRLAETAYASKAMGGLIAFFPRAELLATLERVGLARHAAETFLDNASLKSSSRDLFDQPLVRLPADTMMLFGPGVMDADPNRVTMSALSNAKVQLERKGKAFEAEMLRYFAGMGYAAQDIKFTVDGNEYEFDVVVPWDDHVFIFECKNRSLSGNNPVQAAYFWMETVSAIRQVTRLAEGMRKHADVVLSRFGLDITGKAIVPCVLNSLPYALKGNWDGGFVTDASSLTRFFADRHFHAINPRRTPEGSIEETRTQLASIWAGEKPTPADLTHSLADPLQLRLLLARARSRAHKFQLDERTIVVVKQVHFAEVTSDDLVKYFASANDVSLPDAMD